MTHSPGGDWLMWPQAVAWLICGDRDEVAKIGEYFRARMASNESADIVFDIHMAGLPQKHVVGPVEGGPMGAMEQAETSLFDMLEKGAVISEGKRAAAESPVQIQANDWRDTTIRAGRTFDLQDRHSRVTKFFDVRLLANALPGWNDENALGHTADAVTVEDETGSQTTGRWSDKRMRAEIAACQVGNRDRAWREIFRPSRQEHGWDAITFRSVWSEYRNTKGMTGRPPKRAS